ncbi:MAG: hypothetical protein ABJM06_07835 [Gilvibacter sp.]
MSDQGQYIVADPLGIDQNFKLLKEEGFSLVEQISDTEWTNLNPSDPGVTILEQLCYALTELGYCASFSMQDLLTDKDGKLSIKDQFYLPQNILTTTPITPNDYRRFLVDALPAVLNAQVIPSIFHATQLSNVYVVYLNVGQKFRNKAESLKICKQAVNALSTVRNLGEYFIVRPLEPTVVTLKGTLELTSDKSINQLLASLQSDCDNYVFRDVIQYGYDYLTQDETTNQIFNGPKLSQGWIPDQELGAKKEVVNRNEIESLIGQDEQVSAIKDLKLYAKGSDVEESEISSLVNQIIVIDIFRSVINGGLALSYDGKKIKKSDFKFDLKDLIKYYELNKQTDQVNSVSMAPTVSSGTFRDVESYYAVQNTFPSIYPTGNNAVEANASANKIAESRQLRGYLSLFDQVLANEFSQLANVSRLFSFRNATTGTPFDSDRFYELKNKYQKEHLEYPVPFETFSPTYFYRSLYEVPNIRPLLKNNDAFSYATSGLSDKELENKSWEQYKDDPYNAYIWGLKLLTQQDAANLERRSTMLDHLLARVGVSPLRFNALIEGTIYTNNRLQDSVICKSIYLQNYQTLSYNKTKGYNFLTAQPFVKSDDKKLPDLDLVKDFIFDSKQIDALEKIGPKDVKNYSTLELTQWMLLGLRVCYRNLLSDAKNKLTPLQKRQIRWLALERKGCILIENKLLFKSASFRVVFKEETILENIVTTSYWANPFDQPLSFSDAVLISQWAGNQSSDSLFAALEEQQKIPIPGEEIKFKSVRNTTFEPSDYKNLNAANWQLAVEATWLDGTKAFINDSQFSATASMIFPKYVTTKGDSFKESVCRLIDQETAVHKSINVYYSPAKTLQTIIMAFKSWHNSLIFKEDEKDKSEKIKAKAKESNGAGKLINEIRTLTVHNCE